MLLSYETVLTTRGECKRILESLGVKVVIENADGAGVLKCRTDELRQEPTSNPIILKPVKFRVEFTLQASVAPSHSPMMLNTPMLNAQSTALTLVMEKGAHSTFKAVHAALRRYWELDYAPRSPNGGGQAQIGLGVY